MGQAYAAIAAKARAANGIQERDGLSGCNDCFSMDAHANSPALQRAKTPSAGMGEPTDKPKWNGPAIARTAITSALTQRAAQSKRRAARINGSSGWMDRSK